MYMLAVYCDRLLDANLVRCEYGSLSLLAATHNTLKPL